MALYNAWLRIYRLYPKHIWPIHSSRLADFDCFLVLGVPFKLNLPQKTFQPSIHGFESNWSIYLWFAVPRYIYVFQCLDQEQFQPKYRFVIAYSLVQQLYCQISRCKSDWKCAPLWAMRRFNNSIHFCLRWCVSHWVLCLAEYHSETIFNWAGRVTCDELKGHHSCWARYCLSKVGTLEHGFKEGSTRHTFSASHSKVLMYTCFLLIVYGYSYTMIGKIRKTQSLLDR